MLPPDNWERHALLSLRELRAKNEKIRLRRNLLREEATPNKSAGGYEEEKMIAAARVNRSSAYSVPTGVILVLSSF